MPGHQQKANLTIMSLAFIPSLLLAHFLILHYSTPFQTLQCVLSNPMSMLAKLVLFKYFLHFPYSDLNYPEHIGFLFFFFLNQPSLISAFKLSFMTYLCALVPSWDESSLPIFPFAILLVPWKTWIPYATQRRHPPNLLARVIYRTQVIHWQHWYLLCHPSEWHQYPVNDSPIL